MLQALDAFSLFTIKSLISGIEKDTVAVEQALQNGREQNARISTLILEAAASHDAIMKQIAELRELKTMLAAGTESFKRLRRQSEKQKVYH